MKSNRLGWIFISFISTSCMPDFRSQSEVIDRRVLAIQVDPPELANGVPSPPFVKTQALVVDPSAPTENVSYEWRGCGLEARTGREGTPFGANASSPSGRCDGVDSAILIAQGTAALGALEIEAPIPPSALALMQEPELGQPAMALRLQLKINSRDGDLYAIKDIALTRKLPRDQVPNKNPVISGIDFDGMRLSRVEGAATVKWGSCPSGDLKEVKDRANDKKVKVCSHTVKPAFDAPQSEYYIGKSYDDKETSLRESLAFSFFTDQGSFSNATTDQPPPEADPDQGLQTRWEEPVAKTDRATIWVVVNDRRGGVSWSQYQVNIE
jgi:hypothetical protein